MKTKFDVCEELKNQGVHAEVDRGILWLYGISMRSAKKLLREVGYDASFGIRPEKVKDNGQ